MSRRNREKRENRRRGIPLRGYERCVKCRRWLYYPESYVPFAGDHKPHCGCRSHPKMHVTCAVKAHPKTVRVV